MEDLEVQNTQNKVYNDVRRTYIDKSDCKEGEAICRKCKGRGQIMSEDASNDVICSKCLGRGIVDWVKQAVVRPIIFGADSSSSSSSSSYSVRVASGPGYKPVKLISIKKEIFPSNWLTKYKRRKIV